MKILFLSLTIIMLFAIAGSDSLGTVAVVCICLLSILVGKVQGKLALCSGVSLKGSAQRRLASNSQPYQQSKQGFAFQTRQHEERIYDSNYEHGYRGIEPQVGYVWNNVPQYQYPPQPALERYDEYERPQAFYPEMHMPLQ